MKDKIYLGNSYKSTQALKQAIVDFHANVPLSQVRAAIDRFPAKVVKFIANEGKHFDKH